MGKILSRLSDEVPWIIASITALSFMLLETHGIRFGGPTIPFSWGLAKDLLDVVIVIIFPWNGWIFVCPLVAGIVTKWRYSKLLALWLSMSFVIGFGDTFISFDQISLVRCMKGISFYLTVFGFIGVVVLLISGLIFRRETCQK